MHEIKSRLEETAKFIHEAVLKVDLEGKKQEIKELNIKMSAEGFWDDPKTAGEISAKASHIQKTIDMWEKIVADVDELLDLLPEIHPENDPESAEDFKNMVYSIEKRWHKLEISTFLNGKYDTNNAIVSIHAGTGGTDAQDFAEMLMRMYLRYAEKNDFHIQLVDKSSGEEAGVKSTTFIIEGDFAYGYLKGESGVHRLVRLSPFNSKHTRETSFALVEIIPKIEENDELKINPDDLKVDVFRAGGKGGQSVNTTDSAVRITHIPTGTVVQCQNERSQLQNKEYAMTVLRGRLVSLMQEKRAEKLDELRGEKTEMSWGNQIRSYVLHPYKMVKDHRTNYEESNPDAVLDGEIDGFIEAELKKVA